MQLAAELDGPRQLLGPLLQQDLLGLGCIGQSQFPLQDLTDLRQGHFQHTQHTDQFQVVYVFGRVISVAIAPPGRNHQTLCFIKPNILTGYAALFSRLLDIHIGHLRWMYQGGAFLPPCYTLYTP